MKREGIIPNIKFGIKAFSYIFKTTDKKRNGLRSGNLTGFYMAGYSDRNVVIQCNIVTRVYKIFKINNN